jgi:hypothetical protein
MISYRTSGFDGVSSKFSECACHVRHRIDSSSVLPSWLADMAAGDELGRLLTKMLFKWTPALLLLLLLQRPAPYLYLTNPRPGQLGK